MGQENSSAIIKNDIASVEEFKQSVFNFLSEINQETIRDYYLNQMASDLGIDINSLKKDFNNVKHQYQTSQNEIVNNVVLEPKKEVVKLSEIKITKAIRRAYQIIIKHSIYDHKKLNKYLAYTQEFYPGKDLVTEFSIIQSLELEVLANPKLINTSKFAANNINALSEEPLFKEYIDLIINDDLIDISNDDDFEQSLDTIKKFIKKIKTRDIKNRVIRGDEKAIKDFTASKKDENNI